MDRLIDRVVRIAARAVDMRDRVTRRACDAGLRGRMFLEIEVRVVERATEKRHHVMATSAPTRSFYVVVPLERNLARLTHSEEVRLVVKRTEMMCAMKPAFIRVLVALEAIVVHHQRTRGNEIPGRRARERRMEIVRAFSR